MATRSISLNVFRKKSLDYFWAIYMLYIYLLHEQLVCRLESWVRIQNPYSPKVPVSVGRHNVLHWEAARGWRTQPSNNAGSFAEPSVLKLSGSPTSRTVSLVSSKTKGPKTARLQGAPKPHRVLLVFRFTWNGRRLYNRVSHHTFRGN